jgi:broad specificity phosphatase PhoE
MVYITSMFTKPERVVLVRHGVPDPTDWSGDPQLDPNMAWTTDMNVEDIDDSLFMKGIGEVILLTSPAKRTVQTAERIAAVLSHRSYQVRPIVECDALAKDSVLGENKSSAHPLREKQEACEALAAYMDTLVEGPNTAIVAVTHEPVIKAVATLSGMPLDDMHFGYAEFTVVK